MAIGAAELLDDLPDRPLNNKASRGITSNALVLGTWGTADDAHCFGTFLLASIIELSELESCIFGPVNVGPAWALACIAGAVDRRVLTLSKDRDLLALDDIPNDVMII